MSETPAPIPCGCSTPEAAPDRQHWLARLPRGVTAGVILALLVLGLIIGSGWVGASMVVLGLLAFAAVIALTWPHISNIDRILRVAVFVFIAGLALVRFLPN